MKYFFVFLLLSCAVSGSAQSREPKIEPIRIGESVSMFSGIMHEERVLNIYLPADYGKDSGKRYPVIYLLDGSMDEDFVHIAGLVQFGTFPWVKMLPESIVVGIANVDRKRDFTFPTKREDDKKKIPQSGHSARFMQYIEQEVLPYVEAHYHTAGTRTIIGQSLGGLLATEILLKRPDLFTHYIIISPSLWWDGTSLLQTQTPDLQSARVYIAVGDEGDMMVQPAKALVNKLKNNGSVSFEYFGSASHANIMHEAVYRAFGKLFHN